MKRAYNKEMPLIDGSLPRAAVQVRVSYKIRYKVVHYSHFPSEVNSPLFVVHMNQFSPLSDNQPEERIFVDCNNVITAMDSRIV